MGFQRDVYVVLVLDSVPVVPGYISRTAGL